MAEAAQAPQGSMKTMLAGAGLALALGGAGFYAVYGGMVELPLEPATTVEAVAHAKAVAEFEKVAPQTGFVALEPIIISLGGGPRLRQLQFVAQLEIDPAARAAVEALQPRVRDVLNTYLRAVQPEDVENPASLLKMRAQMLRRVQVVTGEGMVRDLLVSEFILR